MDKELAGRLFALRERVVSHFTAGDWEEVGLLTGQSKRINNHQRLLRSLSFGDADYSGNVLHMLRVIAEDDPADLDEFDTLLDKKYPEESHYVSAKPSANKLTFAPSVFQIPEAISVECDLVAVMMPFAAEFNDVILAIRRACEAVHGRCLRVDDIWEDSAIIQDIFNLLLKAKVVIVDFTGKNPNVMYETGIAHTLGKLVIPIAQSLNDVPFDMQHHRVLNYLQNRQGLEALTKDLTRKLQHADIEEPF